MNNFSYVNRLISDLRKPRRKTAIAQLLTLGSGTYSAVLNSLENESVSQMEGAAVFFQAAGPLAAHFLLQARANGGWPTENYAAQVISYLDASYVPHVRPLANDTDPKIRALAVELLGQFDAVGEAPALIAAMQDHEPAVRASTAGVLHGVGTYEAMKFLIEGLDGHRPWFERAAAARSLGIVGQAMATWPLIHCLDDEDQNVRDSAAVALGQIGDRISVVPLIVAMQKRAFPAAIGTLGQIRDARAVRPLVAYLVDRHENDHFLPAVEALAQIGPAAVKALVDALDDENDDMRYGAVRALGYIGLEYQDARVVAPLLSRWRDPHENPHMYAKDAVARLGSLAVTAVLAMAKGRGRRREFAESILEMME